MLRVKKPIILIANKIDDAHLEIYNLWSLGMGQLFGVGSARVVAWWMLWTRSLRSCRSTRSRTSRALGGSASCTLVGRPNVGVAAGISWLVLSMPW